MSADLEAILRLEVPLIVRVGERRMQLEEVVHLSPGAIIELPKRLSDPLDILVNNKAIGEGQAVKVGENYGIRVTRMAGQRQTIAAMGNDDPAGDAAETVAQDAA